LLKSQGLSSELHCIFSFSPGVSSRSNILPCNAMHGVTKAFLSVRLSVKRVRFDKMKETCALIVIPHERMFIIIF